MPTPMDPDEWAADLYATPWRIGLILFMDRQAHLPRQEDVLALAGRHDVVRQYDTCPHAALILTALTVETEDERWVLVPPDELQQARSTRDDLVRRGVVEHGGVSISTFYCWETDNRLGRPAIAIMDGDANHERLTVGPRPPSSSASS